MSTWTPPNHLAMPQELKKLPHWVCWRAEERQGSKPTKVPYNAKQQGRHASTKDPNTWADFDTAWQSYEASQSSANPFTGVGFVLYGKDEQPERRIGAIDIDACVSEDGEISPQAQAVLDALDPAYVEFSPSGKGLRGFGYVAQDAQSYAKGFEGQALELYTHGRYLTLTGDIVGNYCAPLREISNWKSFIAQCEAGQGQADLLVQPERAPMPEPAAALPAPVPVEDLPALQRYMQGLPNPNASYDDYLRVGMALHHATEGSAEGLAMWNAWAAKIANYHSDKQGQKWASFGDYTGKPVTAGALLHMGQKWGYNPPEAALRQAYSVTFNAHDFGEMGQEAEQTKLMQPEPLRAPLAPAEPYPVECLGPLAPAVRALHQVTQAPLALCAQSVLGAASLAAQAHYDVVLPFGGTAPLSLFLVTVAKSGERKSTVDKIVTKPFADAEKEEGAAYNKLFQEYIKQSEAYEVAKKAAIAAAKGKGKTAAPPSAEDVKKAIDGVGNKPIPPLMPKRLIGDPTVEGIFKLLAVAQPSVGLFNDEAGQLIGGHALNSDNAMKTYTWLSQGWDGKPIDRVRAGDGVSVLNGRRIAAHLMAQPVVANVLLGDAVAQGQGFLARCLIAWPQSTIGTRIIDEEVGFQDASKNRDIVAFQNRIAALIREKPITAQNDPQELEPCTLRLDAEHQSFVIEIQNDLEKMQQDGQELYEVTDRASKALEQAYRIAGVLSVYEEGTQCMVLNFEHLQRAVNLMQWYLAEALRLRDNAVVTESVSDAEGLMHWLREKGHAVFCSAMVLQGGPSSTRNKKRFDAAVKELVQAGYLQEIEGMAWKGKMTRKAWLVLHDLEAAS